jgi:Tfp pilus assembly protein PilF
LARLTLVKGSAEESLQQAREAVKDDAGNPVAHMVFADSLIGNRKAAEAAVEVQKLLAQFPNSSAVHVRAGRLALLNNNAADARRSFDRALALEPRSLDAVSGLVAADIAQRRPADATARVEQYLEKTPNDPGLMLLAGRVYAATGNAAKAQSFLERVTRADPNNATARGMLGQVYLAQNKLDEARQTFEEISRRQPQDLNSEVVVAMIFQAQNQPDAARKRYEAILERDPNSATAANNLAWLYADSDGDLRRAGELAERAKRLMPGDARVTDTAGWVYYKQGLPSLAAPEFEHSVAKDPNNALYHFHLGLAYRQAGDEAKGREELEKALKLQPDFAGAGEARAALAR